MNKHYSKGGPVKALGRFWFVLPWPLSKKDKALAYLREYQRLFPDDAEGRVFLAEVLIDRGSRHEAWALLKKVSATGTGYYRERANQLLDEL